MTVEFNPTGGIRSDALGKPSVTSKQAIYTQPTDGQAVILSLRATNSSGSPVNLTLHFYDISKTTEAEIYPITAAADGTTTLIDMGGLTLDPGDELRATAGTADALDLVLTYAIRRGGM